MNAALRLGCALAVASGCAVAAPLKSPWDAKSVAPTGAAYDCPAPVVLAPEVTVVNRDMLNGPGPASTETRANAYAESSAALRDSAGRIVRAADVYREKGNLNAARCVMTLLNAAAADHAWTGWMSSRESVYEQTIGLRAAAVAYLKTAGSGVATAEQRAAIEGWMAQLAQEQRKYYESETCKHGLKCYEHRDLAGAQAIALVAIARDDKREFGWALGQYREAVKQVDLHGMLAEDFDGQLTLKFQLESAGSLVQIAEYASLNGVDLYGYNHGAVHALVRVATRGLLDPASYRKVAGGVPQEIPPTVEGWEIAWATPYVRRFPDPVISSLIAQSDTKGLYEWGGLPLS